MKKISNLLMMALLAIGMGLTSCDEQLDNAVVPGVTPGTGSNQHHRRPVEDRREVSRHREDQAPADRRRRGDAELHHPARGNGQH